MMVKRCLFYYVVVTHWLTNIIKIPLPFLDGKSDEMSDFLSNKNLGFFFFLKNIFSNFERVKT
jgi:hypothetical protein